MVFNDNKYELSLVIPVFNVESYIQEFLDSLNVQKKELVEFIFINDNSDDGSALYVEKWIDENNYQAKLINHPINLGLSSARNTGIENASGKYIWFVDSDDVISPDFLNLLLQKITHIECDIFVHDFSFLYGKPQSTHDASTKPSEDAPLLVPCKSRKLRTGLLNSDEFIAALFDDKILYAWSFVVRRSLIRETRFPKNRYFEDIMTLPILLMAADTVFYDAVSAIHYRQRPESIMGKRFLERDLDMLCSMSMHYDLFLQNKEKINLDEQEAWLAFSIQTIVWGIRDIGAGGHLDIRDVRSQVHKVIARLRATFTKREIKIALIRMQGIDNNFDIILGRWLIFYPRATVFFMRQYFSNWLGKKFLGMYVKKNS